MNRAERRRISKEMASDPMISMKKSDIDKIKMDASKQAADIAFELMLAIPVMIIHDKFGQLMKKDGREETFTELCLDLYDSFGRGYVTIEDLRKCLWEEAGVKMNE